MLVDATPAKIKIAELLDAGWGTRRIAKEAGVSRKTVMRIMGGQSQVADVTRYALSVLTAEPDPAAIEHRALVEAGMRGDYTSPRREYRRRYRLVDRKMSEWMAGKIDGPTLEKALRTGRRRPERMLPFPERYAEFRHHCGLSDWAIAKRLGIKETSLLRQLGRYDIEPTPEFVTFCTETRRDDRETE